MSALRNLSFFAVPLLAAALLATLAPTPFVPGDARDLHTVVARHAAELETLFAELDYYWPPVGPSAGTVPPIAVRSMPGDLATLTVAKRKTLFFRTLAPLVAAENRRLREQRAFLEAMFARYPQLPEDDLAVRRLRAIAHRFDVGGDLNLPENRARLLRRVDIVPAALVLAQAANESGWGTSRFAREANNLFGMWTWNESVGIVPRRRDGDANHFIRVFTDLRAAVRNYLHTLNVGPAFLELRQLRARQRARDNRLTALELAAGLHRYSARGQEYVDEIRSIISYNGLHDLPPLNVDDTGAEGSPGIAQGGR